MWKWNKVNMSRIVEMVISIYGSYYAIMWAGVLQCWELNQYCCSILNALWISLQYPTLLGKFVIPLKRSSQLWHFKESRKSKLYGEICKWMSSDGIPRIVAGVCYSNCLFLYCSHSNLLTLLCHFIVTFVGCILYAIMWIERIHTFGTYICLLFALK